MELKSDPKVEELLYRYPNEAKTRLLYLRSLILKTASEIKGLHTLEETLRWGEPSYITKNGSTLRIDWKEKNPDQVAIYFQCTSKLVPTFKTIYRDLFTFEGNRALIFKLDHNFPEQELQHCISMALQYHRIKHLPLLGA